MAKIAKCEGELVIKRSGGLEFSFYEVEFVMSDAVKDINQARSVIQAGLLTDRLSREVESFKNWRTCQVISFDETSQDVTVSEIEKLLIECTERGCLPENINSYKTEGNKIKALKRAIENNTAIVAAAKEKEKAEAVLKLAGA